MTADEFKRMIRETRENLDKRAAIVRRIIEAMPPPIQDVARLHYQGGELTEGQVANKLNWPLPKTHNSFKRTRDMLQVGIALLVKEDLKQFRDSVRELRNSLRDLCEGFRERFPDDYPDVTGDCGEVGPK